MSKLDEVLEKSREELIDLMQVIEPQSDAPKWYANRIIKIIKSNENRN